MKYLTLFIRYHHHVRLNKRRIPLMANRDKGKDKSSQKKDAKHTLKEKRKLKQEKRNAE